MRIAFVVIGNSRRSNFLNGHTLRHDGAGGSGTDTSAILVAEFLAKNGHEVVIATDTIDAPLNDSYKTMGRSYTPGESFYGVQYTNLNFDGIENKTFDVLVGMLWFEDYESLPIKVTKSLIYWSHMQWVYGTYKFVDYAEKYNLSIGLVHISNWEEKMNEGTFPYIQAKIPRSIKKQIPNPIFDEIINEVKAENHAKKKGKFIFHASWPRGGNVSVDAVRSINIPDKEFHAFDYLMVIHDHRDAFFHRHDGVDKKTLFKHLAESEYFIYPLYTPYQDVHKDTFSCVVAEAIALGVIVITYPLGALPDVFKNYCAWLNEPPGVSFENMQNESLSKDLDGRFLITSNIVDKFNEIESNPVLKQELQTAGSDYVLENYNIQKVGEMWLNLINDLII